ncbi:hypothetical protein INT47_000414, partial [Mucor saturninus]
VTRDLEYLSLESRYKELVQFSDDLCLETTSYRDGLTSMLHHQLECANNLAEVYGLAAEPEMLHNETNLSPEKQQVLEDYATSMVYCREETLLLIDDLQRTVIKPASDYQMLTRSIDKTITKRQHKLIDFDRHRVSYIKYSGITDPSPSEEKNMFKMKTQFENAEYDYNHFNDMLKNDLIRFLNLTQHFIEPVVQSFYEIQCRIYGGFYGRLHEVIQHNQNLFPTLSMPIQEGYTFRLSENNAILDLEETEILKGSKSWDRKGFTKSGGSPTFSYQQNDSSNQIRSSLSSLSLNSAKRMQMPSSYSNTSANTPPANNDYRPPNAPPPLKKKPSLPFGSIASNVANKSSSLRNTSMSSIKQDAANAYDNVKRASTIADNHKQGKIPTMSDVKFGYQMSKHIPSSSNYSSTTIQNGPSMSPAGNAAPISPFSDQQEVIKKKRAPPPPPPSRGTPRKEYVEALYDLAASQDGDLSFSVGDRIEIIERSDNTDDWWKGRIGNRVGMFPGLLNWCHYYTT